MNRLQFAGGLVIGISAIMAVLVHWRLRNKLKNVDGWREKWKATVKWITFGVNATTFDYEVQWAVMTGRLSKSTDPDIRRDARILRALLVVIILGGIYLLQQN